MSTPLTYAHIFLVTGPDPALEEDYEKLGDFVRTLNDSLLSWNLYFMLHLCRSEQQAAEELAAAVAAAQEPEKQLYLFIFHEAAALSAQNALTDAIRQLRSGKKLNILVFFRKGGDSAPLEAFKKSLVEDFGHYASEYEHIDSIKLRLLTSLKSIGLAYLPLNYADDRITLGGEELLDVAEMPVFALHPRLAELKAQKALLEPRYHEMHERYVNKDETLAPSEYEETAKRYFVVLQQIPQVEKALLEELQKQTEIINGEMVSPLLARFYQYKEQGKYEEADRLLDYRDLALRKAWQTQKNALTRLENSLLIGEFLAKAKLQKEFPVSPARLAAAEQCYRDAVELAEDAHVRQEALYLFAGWLYDQNRYTAAKEHLERFWQTAEFAQASGPEKARYYNLRGMILADLHDTNAENDYREALVILRELANKNPDAFRQYLATTCNNLGIFYADNGQPAKAEALYREALVIRRELANKNPDAFRPNLAGTCNNLGLFYADNGHPSKAEALCREALDIWRELANKNPDAFRPDLAVTCNNLGNFYKNNGQPAEAEALYREALDIRRELAEKNPDAFRPDLAMICNNLGNFYADNGQPAKAEALYREALDIRRELAQNTPKAYTGDLADTECNIFLFYRSSDMEKALSFLQQAHEHYAFMAPINRHCAEYMKRTAATLDALRIYHPPTIEFTESPTNPSLEGMPP